MSVSPRGVVVADGIQAVGGAVPASTSVSWLPSDRTGFMPVQCYVLRDRDEAVVLDCGLPAHQQDVEASLLVALRGSRRVSLLVSRWEPDAMASLPVLLQRLGIREVMSYGGINPLDFFEGFEAAATKSIATGMSGPARLIPVAPGDRIPVGGLCIEMLSTSLRLLLTNWFYEHRTGTLFTADSFGVLSHPETTGPFLSRITPDDVPTDWIDHCLTTKFDWLHGARCEELVADLKRLQATLRINRICPYFGGVIEGRDSVDWLFRTTITGLRRLSASAPLRPLRGFDWDLALSDEALIDIADARRSPMAPASAR